MIGRAAYGQLVEHYESCLRRHGDNHRGVDWPNAANAQMRYRVMLDVIRQHHPQDVRLLDLGCGASHLYHYMLESNRDGIDYSGLDLSPEFIRLCRSKFPDRPYYCLDILDPASTIPAFDYVVMNGLFTEKRSSHSMRCGTMSKPCWSERSRSHRSEWRSTSCRSTSTGSARTCSIFRLIRSPSS